jgi:hypothetical protein
MMNRYQEMASVHPKQGVVDEPLSPSDTPSGSARPEETKLLKSLVSTYAHVPVESVIVGQYVERLELLLQRLKSRGVDADDLRSKLVTALQNKGTGGFATLACELVAVDHFLTDYPDGFCYQVPSNAPRAGEGTRKSFDFSFEAQGINFHVEVKAFAPNRDSFNGPPVKSFLRPSDTKALYKQGARFSRNCAPAIGRFLLDANSQLTKPARGISVMLLCCNDLDEQADALTCFVGEHGICRQTETQGTVPAPAELPNIDAVVICHLGLLQSSVLDPERFSAALGGNDTRLIDGSNAWDYSRSFPVAFPLQRDRVPPDMQVPFGEVFRSVHAGVREHMQKNGGDAQDALFSVFNEVMSLAGRQSQFGSRRAGHAESDQPSLPGALDL